MLIALLTGFITAETYGVRVAFTTYGLCRFVIRLSVIANVLMLLVCVSQCLQSVRYLLIVQTAFGFDGVRTSDFTPVVRIDY